MQVETESNRGNEEDMWADASMSIASPVRYDELWQKHAARHPKPYLSIVLDDEEEVEQGENAHCVAPAGGSAATIYDSVQTLFKP